MWACSLRVIWSRCGWRSRMSACIGVGVGGFAGWWFSGECGRRRVAEVCELQNAGCSHQLVKAALVRVVERAAKATNRPEPQAGPCPGPPGWSLGAGPPRLQAPGLPAPAASRRVGRSSARPLVRASPARAPVEVITRQDCSQEAELAAARRGRRQQNSGSSGAPNRSSPGSNTRGAPARPGPLAIHPPCYRRPGPF